MSRPIRCSFRYSSAPEAVFGVLTDREFLEARLARIGGPGAGLVDHSATPDAARIVFLQGVSRDHLPGPVRKLLPGDLRIERTETWRLVAPGRYAGEIGGRVKDAPGQVSGTLALTGAGGSCDYVLDGTAKVNVPLVGGKVEELIAEHLNKLIDRESRFAQEWLSLR
ncbi:DUF2505 domain-containing protein [Pseudonocardia eucalypti]|uniref:DUF2505 domain-containing protein n=1 Tax=Pseudonocardia eucalypti TaxID=648755 RepID=A0ABP9Q0W9_9PSEU|nr:hypothetical protein [Pseudonocardia eucalypti]